MGITGREFHLARRPKGWPVADDFELVRVPMPEPAEGELLVANTFLSVDPYMRGRMSEGPSYAASYELGKPMSGGAIGQVVRSRHPSFQAGMLVRSDFGWRTHVCAPADQFAKLPALNGVSEAQFLGTLGLTGFTAYVGLFEIAKMKAGDIVFISAAAGAVGSVAGQLAKIHGASRVIGSAGSREKVEYLTSTLGYDAAFNYRIGRVKDRLAEMAPDGIDVYFDNVGGEQLEAAIGAMRIGGRAAICGAISGYNAEEPQPGPRNLALLIARRATLTGFLVGDHQDRYEQFIEEVGDHLLAGRIVSELTVVEGFTTMPQTFIDLMKGENTGKMVVKV